MCPPCLFSVFDSNVSASHPIAVRIFAACEARGFTPEGASMKHVEHFAAYSPGRFQPVGSLYYRPDFSDGYD